MAGRAVYLRTLRPVPSAGPHVSEHALDGAYAHVAVAAGGGGGVGDAILTEGGDFLVTEGGDRLVLE